MQCRSCSADVPVRAMYVGGIRAPMLRPTCDECLAAEEAALEAAGLVAERVDPEAAVRDWLSAHGVNTRKHGHATFETFDPTDSPKALAAARAFAADVIAAGRHDRVKGLYLASKARETGVGKSHLAVAIMRHVHEARPELRIVYEPADRLVIRVQDTYGSGTTDPLIEERASSDLYVLDDLGREKPTTDALRVLQTILDEREGAPTVITSNFLPHELAARHEDGIDWQRVASRLGDAVYDFVYVVGRDRRFNPPTEA